MSRVVVILVCAAAGCAAQKPQAKQQTAVAMSSPGQPAPKGKEVCHMERDTGSNIMERVCEWHEDKDAQSAGQEALTRIQIQGSVQQTLGR